MRHGIDAHVTQLFLQSCIPMILDVIIGAAGHLRGDEGPSAVEWATSMSFEQPVTKLAVTYSC